MCQYVVIEYSCGHDAVQDIEKCELKLNAGPFQPIEPCKCKEVGRKDPGICRKCQEQAMLEDQKKKAKQVPYAPSWTRKITSTTKYALGKILDEPGSSNSYGTPVAASGANAQTKTQLFGREISKDEKTSCERTPKMANASRLNLYSLFLLQ